MKNMELRPSSSSSSCCKERGCQHTTPKTSHVERICRNQYNNWVCACAELDITPMT